MLTSIYVSLFSDQPVGVGFGRKRLRGLGANLSPGRRQPGGAPYPPARRPTYQQRALRGRVSPRLRVRADGTPDFPNVNRVAFFEDKKALKAIQRAERRRHYAEARTLLTQYVGQFGIENFYRNTDLLWHLGQLWQRDSASARSQELAKTYFRLALKHHRADVRRVQLYYDSLEEKTADLYVPLKVYYEIVEYRKGLNTFHPPKNVYTNMGDAINSKFPDYGPALGAGDSMLLFSSKRQMGKGVRAKEDENLYVSHLEGPNFWSEAQPLPQPINSAYNEGSACFSHDGRTIFFARCECPTCHGNCDLFTATLGKDGQWSVPKSLGPLVNSPAWDSQPTLSPREDTLYFASDRLGGFGLSDIYYTVKGPNGQWGKALNLGPTVNTRESEVSPFYHPLYHVLYFSSRGPAAELRRL